MLAQRCNKRTAYVSNPCRACDTLACPTDSSAISLGVLQPQCDHNVHNDFVSGIPHYHAHTPAHSGALRFPLWPSQMHDLTICGGLTQLKTNRAVGLRADPRLAACNAVRSVGLFVGPELCSKLIMVMKSH